MRKCLKKVGAAMLAMTMVLSLGMTGTAVEEELTQTKTERTGTPNASDTATITVKNVEAGLTVTGYQVIDADYNNGFTGYHVVDGVSINDMEAPSAGEILAIAAGINNGTITGLESEQLTDQGNGVYSADVTVGSWVVIVTAGEDKSAVNVYNPMLLSARYIVNGSNGTTAGGIVDATGNYTIGADEAYAKRTNGPSVSKEITGSGSGRPNGDDVAIGTRVSFKVTTTIPNYAVGETTQYKNLSVRIQDTLKGLSLDAQTLNVKVGTDEWQATEIGNKGSVNTSEHSFSLTLTDRDYILAHTGDTVEITYDAVVGEDAGVNFDANTNSVSYTYTTDPTTGSDYTTAEVNTYHYTFGLDAELNGEGSQIPSQDIVKTGEVRNEAGEIEYKPLGGAGFTLYDASGAAVTTGYGMEERDDGQGGKVKEKVAVTDGEYTTDSEGHLTILGLDAGTYTLKETTATAGYSLNETVYTILITPSYNTDGTLAQYVVTITNDKTDDTVTITNAATAYQLESQDTTRKVPVSVTTDSTGGQEIRNTKLSALPSTGGIGTYLFTMVGAVIMAAAVGIFFLKRRRDRE